MTKSQYLHHCVHKWALYNSKKTFISKILVFIVKISKFNFFTKWVKFYGACCKKNLLEIFPSIVIQTRDLLSAYFFLECHVFKMKFLLSLEWKALQQLPDDSQGEWPREVACIITTIPADATPMLKQGDCVFLKVDALEQGKIKKSKKSMEIQKSFRASKMLENWLSVNWI